MIGRPCQLTTAPFREATVPRLSESRASNDEGYRATPHARVVTADCRLRTSDVVFSLLSFACFDIFLALDDGMDVCSRKGDSYLNAMDAMDYWDWYCLSSFSSSDTVSIKTDKDGGGGQKRLECVWNSRLARIIQPANRPYIKRPGRSYVARTT